MTKVEVFHCAVCETFISSSSSSVRAHVMSQEHRTNIKVGLLTQHMNLHLLFVSVDLLDPKFQLFLISCRGLTCCREEFALTEHRP